MSSIKISDRMRTIESMVISGGSLADVGTDHGFIPLDLLAENEIKYAVLTDINDGPLKLAESHAKEWGFDPKYYCLRKGDGLVPLKNGEVDTVIIAGMGGELIENILDADKEKSHSFKRFVFQPRTHAGELRYYLSTNGFEMVDYKLVKEKGRICEVFAAKPVSEGKLIPDVDLVSKFLLSKNDPLIREFLDYKIGVAESVLENLSNSDSAESHDISNVWRSVLIELEKIRKSL